MNEYITKLKQEIRALEESFHQRPAPDHASYMERVGQVLGLQKSLDILEGLMKEDDDDK